VNSRKKDGYTTTTKADSPATRKLPVCRNKVKVELQANNIKKEPEESQNIMAYL